MKHGTTGQDASEKNVTHRLIIRAWKSTRGAEGGNDIKTGADVRTTMELNCQQFMDAPGK